MLGNLRFVFTAKIAKQIYRLTNWRGAICVWNFRDLKDLSDAANCFAL